MKLSVIMPVYNREEYVGHVLRSLLRQRDAADLDRRMDQPRSCER